MLYYICPLHTFFFGMVYLIMRIKPDWNHSKHLMRVKLMAAGIVVYLVWDFGPYCLWPYVFPYLTSAPSIGATGGLQWEWYFRSTLDHWSTFLGMIFALNYPVAAEWLSVVEKLPLRRQWIVKGVSALLLMGPFVWWVCNILPQDKFSYNYNNAYFSPLFALGAYIFIRNISATLRSHFLGPLEIIGKTTLETYLLQHHLWLTSNAKSLLTLIPGMPVLNFVAVTVLYFAAARTLYKLTMTIRGMILPDDSQKCFQNVLGGAILVGVSFLCSAGLHAVNQVSIWAIMVLIAAAGTLAVLGVEWLLHTHGPEDALGDGPLSQAGTLPPKKVLIEQICCAVCTMLGFGLAMSLMSFNPANAATYLSPDLVCGPQKEPPLKDACSMAQPWLGLFILAISAVMLITRDSFCGIPTMVLYVCENVVISYDQVYAPLHAKIGVVSNAELTKTSDDEDSHS